MFCSEVFNIHFVKTITSDNGKEFDNNNNIADKLNISYFFAIKYHRWEKGTNENLNGLFRQSFPKKADFNLITKADIQKVRNKLNNRPKKRFGHKSPKEFFAEKMTQKD